MYINCKRQTNTHKTENNLQTNWIIRYSISHTTLNLTNKIEWYSIDKVFSSYLDRQTQDLWYVIRSKHFKHKTIRPTKFCDGHGPNWYECKWLTNLTRAGAKILQRGKIKCNDIYI